MRNKETGEFELVVGNGQLVSGFFIVVLLFAVGVAMGYILGQNSEKTAKSQQGDATPCVATDGRPQPAQPAPQQQPPQQAQQDASAQAPATTQAQTPAASEAPQPTTQPAKEPAPAAPEPARQEPAAKPVPPKSATTGTAPSGFFWQVTATANLESARATVKTLKDRGFAAYLVPGRSNLTRVLVGPYKEREAKAKAKSDLEAMGLKPISHTEP